MSFVVIRFLLAVAALVSSKRINAGLMLSNSCANGYEFMVEIDYSKVVPTKLLPESTRSYGMEHYLGVEAPGRLVLCPSRSDQTIILKYDTSELTEFLYAVFQFPPDVVVERATWTKCDSWSSGCLSVKMKNAREKMPAKAVMPMYVLGSRANIAHGTNMHAVYTAVEKTNKQLLPKAKRLSQNVDFNMGAQQAIRDEWNDHFLSVVPMRRTDGEPVIKTDEGDSSGDQWQATTFYWAHAVAHIWTWPRTASSKGALPASPEWGLSGAPKWATLDRDVDGNWIPVYATDDQIPVVATGICHEDLIGKNAGQGSGKVGSEMGCAAMEITDIFVAPSLQHDIEAKLRGTLVVHSFRDMKATLQP